MRFAALFLLSVPAMGAIAHVGSCSTWDDQSNNSYSSISLSPAMNVAAGNIVVISIRGTNTAISVTVGGTAATMAVALGRSNYGTIWYLPNTVANASATIAANYSPQSTYTGGIACQYSGVAISSPLDVTAVDTGSWTVYPYNQATSNAFTTTSASELIVAVGGNSGPYTAGTGYSIFGLNTNSLALEDQIVSTIQAGVIATLTGANYTNPDIVVATFKAAATAKTTSQQFIF